MYYRLCVSFILLVAVAVINCCQAQVIARQSVSLDKSWTSIATESDSSVLDFEDAAFNDSHWKKVNVPHNWDAYDGYRRLRHGNKHGTAWYRKIFQLAAGKQAKKRYFLFFEGVGSYATVWLNGRQIGYHAGGRTSFTIDVTDELFFSNKKNTLAIKAEHPAFIKDLPWVCGGCSDERGFSEGSQPMGIFRPVQLIVSSDVRVQPFGVHAWNDATVSTKSASISIGTDIKNYSKATRSIVIVQKMFDANRVLVAQTKRTLSLKAGEEVTVPQLLSDLHQVRLWNPANPYLYSLETILMENEQALDVVKTNYGIRSVYWSSKDAGKSNQFFINGKPFFINGIAEYEHLMGNSHAFSSEQVKARALQMKAAGFNAFRDGHQPHNLRYDQYWDSLGILWWTQFSAHIWYDSPEFRNEFKALLKEWVIERRNSPSIVLWGLQNESKLPEDFARECSNIIRSLDPTASSQRLITTCNGGAGTDWDVPQNWTGTYGGDPEKYTEDVKRQVLIGEYGAWRTLELHSENGYTQDTVLSEDRMTALMETKVRLAEKAKDSAAGHFFWLFNSHDNPGRVQAGEAYRELDRIGPVNYKGLLTSWEEPTDAYYMYQSNFTNAAQKPMLYIASHTWPDRWAEAGIKSGIIVYSNCDEVALFNDIDHQSLGKKKNKGTGTHFQWDKVNIQYNVLYAVGYVKGKAVAKDCIVLRNLAQAPHFNDLIKATPIIKATEGYHYIYRMNCGGADYTDSYGNKWLADRHKKANKNWGSVSWAEAYPEMPPYFASQRQSYDPIDGTADWPLFQQFRYGRNELAFEFPVPDGSYRVELYFTEPWIGKAGGVDGKGWRLFDVAINDRTVLKNLDLWKEAGHDKAIKKVVNAEIKGGILRIHFPEVAVGQAVISAIAIASKNGSILPAPPSPALLELQSSNKTVPYHFWLTKGQAPFTDSKKQIAELPPVLYGAEWLELSSSSTPQLNGKFSEDADLYIALESGSGMTAWLKDFEDSRANVVTSDNIVYKLVKKRFKANETFSIASEGAVSSAMMVFINHASAMQPPYDLKPLTTYKAADAKSFGASLQKQNMADKPVMVFTQNEADTLEWEFETGVGDIYSLTIKYNNPHEKEMHGMLRLLAVDGSLLKTEEIQFTNTRPGKWNYINTTTGTMINAGKYHLQLSGKDLSGLVLNSLEVQ